MSLAENNGRTTRPGGVTGKGFTKGVSGNPGGRPKGVAKAVREVVGGDPYPLAVALFEIVQDPDARDADKIAAAKELFDRGWGKAPVVADAGGYDPLEVDAMSAEAAAIIDELAQRRNGNGAST